MPVSAARTRLRCRFASCLWIGEKSRSKSRPVSPVATTRGSSASDAISSHAASSTLSASWGWTPTAACSHGNRSTSSSAPRHDAGFQPGTRIRSTPASRAAPTTWSTSASNRSAWRWQWESTRRTGGLSPMRLAGRTPASNLAGQVLVDRDRIAFAVGADRDTSPDPGCRSSARRSSRRAPRSSGGPRRWSRRGCSSASPPLRTRCASRARRRAQRAPTGTGRSRRTPRSG